MTIAIPIGQDLSFYELEQLSTANSATVTALLGAAQVGATRNVMTYADTVGEAPPYKELTMTTLDGDVIVQHGDWVAKSPMGEFTRLSPQEAPNSFTLPPVADTGTGLLGPGGTLI